MATLYLIRHGQAGSRDNYDVLSTLGKQQARLLGAHLAEQQIAWRAMYAGELFRQQQTARLVCETIRERYLSLPELVTDERWNEFSLADVYRGMAPRLLLDDDDFARDYEEMQQLLIADPHATRGAAGRCDRAVIEAWMEDRYPSYEGESWESFRQRVQSSLEDLKTYDKEENVAVFTSATPIAIWVGAALELSPARILRLMAVLYNASITTIKLWQEEPVLLNFNTTPHLLDVSVRTFR